MRREESAVPDDDAQGRGPGDHVCAISAGPPATGRVNGPGYVIMPNQAVKGLRERLRRTMLPPCPMPSRRALIMIALLSAVASLACRASESPSGARAGAPGSAAA